MKDIEKRVAESLDGFNPGIVPYLPYILQDLWELGADPNTVLDLIQKNISKSGLKILDIGCGKGAVSIRLAEKLDCIVYGIDFMKEFIEDAKRYAKQYGVENKCFFRQGDAHVLIDEYNEMDVAILGAVGPVFGNPKETLTRIKPALNSPGYVVLDDGFLDDDSTSTYNRAVRRSEFFRQIRDAGFTVAEELIFHRDKFVDTDEKMFQQLKNRVEELIQKEPSEKELFHEYLKSQEYEFHMLATEIVTGTWLLKTDK